MRTIGLKWVFKVKSDGRLIARLVALGYKQKAGIDYTDIHAPVIHEVALRILLVNKIINNWKAKKIDIEAAFLDSKLDEDIYVNLPEGLENIETTSADEVGKLNAAVYGLVQASREF